MVRCKNVRVVVLGDGSVGKTCLCIRLSNGIFSEKYVPTVAETVSIDFFDREVPYKVNIYDLGGGEDFHRLRPLLYPGTDVFFLCFALDNVTSYNAIQTSWLPELKRHRPETPIILIGTKSDLEPKVTTNEGIALQQSIKAKIYLECSSKAGVGVQDVFEAGVAIYTQRKRSRSRKKKKCVII